MTWIRERGAWRALAVVLLVFCPLVVSGCGEDSAGQDEGTSVEDINEADAFDIDGENIGDTVTVSAKVTDMISPRAFQLSGDDVGGEPLLVVSAQKAGSVNEGDVVQVTGTVREFNYVEYRDDYGLGGEGLYTDYAGDKFIVASKVNQSAPPEKN